MNLLCVISKAPFAGSKVSEQLETAMVGAVFDLEVSLLFTGPGIHCLVNDQTGSNLGMRSLSNLIAGLDMYEINNIYADENSLAADNYIDGIQTVNADFQRKLLAKADIVLGGSL